MGRAPGLHDQWGTATIYHCSSGSDYYFWNLGNGTFQLQCATDAAFPAFLWAGPSNFSATLQNPIATQTGFYTIRVTDLASGCLSYRTVRVAINEKTAPTASDWTIFPNPASEIATLQFTGQYPPALTHIQVLDATGRLCWTGQMEGGVPVSLDLGAFPPGVYGVVFRGDWGSGVKRLVKR